MHKSASEDDFMTVVNLSPGVHHYRFCGSLAFSFYVVSYLVLLVLVDGVWRFSQDQTLSRSGRVVTNTITVKDSNTESASAAERCLIP